MKRVNNNKINKSNRSWHNAQPNNRKSMGCKFNKRCCQTKTTRPNIIISNYNGEIQLKMATKTVLLLILLELIIICSLFWWQLDVLDARFSRRVPLTVITLYVVSMNSIGLIYWAGGVNRLVVVVVVMVPMSVSNGFGKWYQWYFNINVYLLNIIFTVIYTYNLE